MRYLSITLLAFLFACQSPAPVTKSPVIIAYVAGWKDWNANAIDATQLTHINYAFADVIDNKVVSYLENDSANFAILREIRAEHPHIKLLISLGGWGRSKGFSDAGLTKASRDTMARTAVEYMKRYGLDGVDVDWEYPGLPGDDNPHRPEDKENFTLMLKELRKQLDQQSKTDGRKDDPYLLTIATGASKNYIDHTELGKAQKYLDYVNIMTYDFAGGGDSLTQHHTNLFATDAQGSKGRGSDLAVAEHIAAGVPASKIVLGAAFYGKGWKGAGPENNGLHQPVTSFIRGGAFHTLLAEKIDKNGYVRYWDEQARAPYLYHADSTFFITYDDTMSIRYKCDFIKEKGLAGVMFWEYSSDTTGTLLKALNEGLKDN